VRSKFTIALNSTKGNPRCDEPVKRAIGAGLWNRLCVLYAQVGASDVVKELHALSEEALLKKQAVRPAFAGTKRNPRLPG